MAHPNVETAIYDHFVANWTRCAIMQPNVDMALPGDGSPWLLINYPVSRASKVTLRQRSRETGSIRVVVAVEIGIGGTKSRQWAEEIAALLSRKTIGGVVCDVASVGDGFDDGSNYRRSVIVPYRYEFTVV